MRFIIPLLLLILMELTAVPAFAASECGELKNHYGPFDYTNPEHFKTKLWVVENRHFTPQIENLIQGESGYLWADLDYTLRAFPNHHRALYAFARYDIRERQSAQRKNQPYRPPFSKGFPATADCYFDRAIRWRPRDPSVYLIYGVYLQRMGKLDQALEKYKISEKLQPNSADLQYNIGLLYFEQKNYTLAKQHARKAYQLGYPLAGLRNKLTSVGQWP